MARLFCLSHLEGKALGMCKPKPPCSAFSKELSLTSETSTLRVEQEGSRQHMKSTKVRESNTIKGGSTKPTARPGGRNSRTSRHGNEEQ